MSSGETYQEFRIHTNLMDIVGLCFSSLFAVVVFVAAVVVVVVLLFVWHVSVSIDTDDGSIGLPIEPSIVLAARIGLFHRLFSTCYVTASLRCDNGSNRFWASQQRGSWR